MGNGSNFAFAPAHPGEYLREDVLPELAKVGISKAQFAQHLGISRTTLYSVLREKQDITTTLACRLGRALGNGARFWLTLQMQYDLWKHENDACDVEPLPLTHAA
ncbi:MAG: HigA family addiction module antitoxin [Rhodomicrobiaceae bacterium]